MGGSEQLRRPRRLGQLGGTTDLGDCASAAAALVWPRRPGEATAIADFEDAFATRTGTSQGVSFATGRVGLHTTLALLGVGPGDEVLVQVPTHVVVANAIRYLRAQPVFVDTDLATLGMDMTDAASKITGRTRALVLQHTFGVPADIDGAAALARRNGLVLVEDCVHALGATWRGRPLGSFGDAAFFSTEETKVISTTLGGMVVTSDALLARRLRERRDLYAWPSDRRTAQRLVKLIAYHVLTWPPIHRYSRAAYEAVGRRHPLPLPVSDGEARGEVPDDYFERLPAAQARLGRRQLDRLDANVTHRQRIAAIYAAMLHRRGALDLDRPGAAPSFVRFPIVVADRDAASRATRAHVVLGTWFTSVLEEAATVEAVGYVPGSCPVAEWLTRHLANLPTHPRVSEADARAIATAVRPWCADTSDLQDWRWQRPA